MFLLRISILSVKVGEKEHKKPTRHFRSFTIRTWELVLHVCTYNILCINSKLKSNHSRYHIHCLKLYYFVLYINCDINFATFCPFEYLHKYIFKENVENKTIKSIASGSQGISVYKCYNKNN